MKTLSRPTLLNRRPGGDVRFVCLCCCTARTDGGALLSHGETMCRCEYAAAPLVRMAGLFCPQVKLCADVSMRATRCCCRAVGETVSGR